MGYSFNWILAHLSQSYQIASASWAGYAVSASYIPLLAGPNITINYQANGIAITGSGGGGGGASASGPSGSIQFASASLLSGSSNFTFDNTSNILYLTGAFYVSGGISASYGANTVGFIGTASWAQSASNAFTASFITASNVWGPYGSSSVISASIAVTASFAGAAGNALSASYADYAAVAGTLVDNIWVRSTGDNSAVINDESAQISIADGSSSIAYGDMTYAYGNYAASQGKNTEAIGTYTHAEGVSTYAIGEGSHAEGYNTRTGVEGQPYYPEETYITSSNFKTYTQFSASLVPLASTTARSDQAPLVSIDDPNSSMYGLTFQFLYDSGSVSGSNNIYESSSVAIYDSVTRNLLAHEDLSKFYDTSSMDGALPRAITIFAYGPVSPNQAWHEKHTDTIKVAYSHYGQGFTAYIGMISCSYDGTTLSSLYIHNTASYHPVSRLSNGLGGSHVGSGNNVVNNWTGSIASETRWTGSAPSVQFNGSVIRSYPPMPSTFWYGSFYNVTYNEYNNKTYAIGDWIQNSPTAGPSGIYIFNSDFQLEYTGSIGTTATTGIGSGGTLSYQIHGGTIPAGAASATATDIGFRSTISGSVIKGAKPAVDKNGNVWFTTNTTTAGNPVHLFALKANGSVSSSNANLFAYVINHQNMGISASALSPPYYYPGDGTINSERIFVCVNYPYGSGSINTSYTKWLGYDLSGVLKNNPWGNASTPQISIQRIVKGNLGLYWWNKLKVFVLKSGDTIYILSKDGAIQASTTTSRPGSLFDAGTFANAYEVQQNRTLVVEGFYLPGGTEAATGSLFWIDKRITSASIGQYSHAEGIGSAAGGIGSHAEGYYTVATGSYSHAEGVSTRAIASGSHAEGLFTTASGQYSHAEGSGSVASGIGAHAEGKDTIAIGQYSHAEGSSSVAFGTGSHAGGLFTVASGSFQTTVGTYNLLNNTIDLFVIGDGASTASRHDLLNASTGVVRISGSLIVSNSFSVIGNTSFNGNTSFTGSLIVSNSLNVIGTSGVTGSSIISGSQTIIGTEQITGSLIVSNSFTVIGTNTTTGSVYITGSSTLIGNSTITGSILMTGSAAISSVNYIDFVTTANPTHNEGRVHWLDDTKTIQVDTEVSNFNIELGHQSIVRVYNPNSYTMTPGMVVYISGSQGNRPSITTASWEGDPSSAGTIGFVATTIGSSGNGYVITNGLLRNVDTNAFNVGDRLFLSSSGQFTNTPPDAPLHEVRLGNVIVQNATTGVIYVGIMNGYELTELHDVKTTTYTDGDLLVQSSSLWINSKQLTGSYGLTGSLVISGTLAVSSSYGTQTQPAVQVNNDGLLILGEYSTTPTAIAGAMMYSGSEYYLGFA